MEARKGGDGNTRWDRKVKWEEVQGVKGVKAKREENGEACGRKVGERGEEVKEVCREVYEEDNVRSAPLILQTKQKACVEFRLKKKGMCEADKRGMALPNWCF